MTTETDSDSKENSFDKVCELADEDELTENEFAAEWLSEIFFVPQSVFHLPVEALPVSVRLRNVLNALNITDFGGLNEVSFIDFQNIRNCGAKTMTELQQLLERAKQGEFDDYVQKLETRNIIGDLVERISQAEDNCDDSETYSYLFLDEQLYIPRKLQDVPLSHFPCSVRLLNVLKKLGVYIIGDLQKISLMDLSQARNCGKKTINELHTLISQIQNTADAAAEGAMLRKFSGQMLAGEKSFEISTKKLTLAEMLVFINEFLDELPPNRKDILLSRYGGTVNEKPLTLEEIAVQQGVTRERIRQIQANCLKNLVARLQFVSNEALDELCDSCLNSVCPLTPGFLVFLTHNDYAAFVHPSAFYVRLLAEFRPNLPTFVNNQVKPANQLSVEVGKIVNRIKDYLSLQNGFVTVKEVFANVMFYGEYSDESQNAFFESIRANAFITENGDAPDSLLIALNRSRLTMNELARRVLAESSHPLTPEEIIERGRQVFGDKMEMPAPNSIANLPGSDSEFYLLDRRAIGLRQHFRLPLELWETAKSDFHRLLSESGRTYSTTEVFASRMFEWTKLTNSSETAQILRGDKRFKDLGRFNFALIEWQIEEREPIKELIVRVLEQAAHPLTSAEIGVQLQQLRSVSLTSLPAFLRGHAQVKVWSFGFYGLKTWQHNFADFFVVNPKAINGIIKQGESISFTELCKQIGISPYDELADKLWQTLQEMPKMRTSAMKKSPEAIVTRTVYARQISGS